MSEEQAGTAVQEQEFEYPATIEEVGPGTKKIIVEIPRDRIDQKLQEQFKEIRQQAAIPGFRPGHAPQRLVEKKFASDVRDEVRRTLISESYEQVLKKNELHVLGDPEFDSPEDIKLPDEGPLSYSFQVEVQPEILLPPVLGLKIKKPKIQITDENVDQAMNNLREQQGMLVPVEDRGVEAKDRLTADVQVKVGDEVISDVHDVELVATPARLAGIMIEDLDKQLEGLKSGKSRTLKATAPDTHPDERLRGREVEITIKLKEIKRMELAEVDQDFLDRLGFASEKDLREALRQEMVQRVEYDVQQTMREQVYGYLLEKVAMELPQKLSERQTERIVQRRMIDQMMRGVPREQVEADAERLRHGAREEAARELKLFFILQKVAEQQEVDVGESELNGRIAMLAAQQGRRPEKVKQEMAADGSLLNMYVQMREQKAVDKIIQQAEIEEVEPEKK